MLERKFDGERRLARKTGAEVRLESRPAMTSPGEIVRPTSRGTHWTSSDLVAQIGFAEWTAEGRLRQPRFLGLRDDKRATEVVRERPE